MTKNKAVLGSREGKFLQHNASCANAQAETRLIFNEVILMCKCAEVQRQYDNDGDVVFEKQRIQDTLATINSSNQVDYMMQWEDGQLCPECTIAFFQYLINTGLAWSLQGMYGRMATDLIDAGYCTRRA